MSLVSSLGTPLKAGLLPLLTRSGARRAALPCSTTSAAAAPPDLIVSRITQAPSRKFHGYYNYSSPRPYFSSSTSQSCRWKLPIAKTFDFNRNQTLFYSTNSPASPQTPTMSELKAGDSFPEGVKFSYVPVTAENAEFTACGVPQTFDASAEFKNKKVVLVAVPGAFTPTCSAAHVPSYVANLDKLKAKGVDQVIFIAFNDAWVMSAWGKANNIKDEYILFAADPEAKFSKSIGWTMGERTARYAIVIDHGKVTYAALEDGAGIEKSGAEAVLSRL